MILPHHLSLAVWGVTLAATISSLAPDAAALPDAYSAAEIRGWVVDAETKRPLEGVHVVAQWILRTGLLSSQHVQRLKILETVTDHKGEYYFPAWGPEPRPPLSVLEWGDDPILRFFKPGYKPGGAVNYSPPPDNDAEMAQRVSRWHGKTITLEPFRGTQERWALSLSGLQVGLGWGHETGDLVRRADDNWKHMPRMVLAIVEQRRLLPEQFRPIVRRLEVWDVTEPQLRALIKQEGVTP
jgi:hypothetical protein